jgi:hypothetical protein
MGRISYAYKFMNFEKLFKILEVVSENSRRRHREGKYYRDKSEHAGAPVMLYTCVCTASE